ncbi:hypothetical protein PENSTE_c013G10225 [Penicillium steckii]|uniref:Uncharacterized protein n=1 Tax=Penicillium steckii TaxID=303698 RepID=A0A1V6T3S0_9EURO|nr:hypothetical protein PENSTE_c013G10225 [Penicillium steckii]
MSNGRCFENEGVRSYINDLRGGREVLVDHIYCRILQMLFPWEDRFLHEREEYPAPDSQRRSDVTLSAIINGRRKKLLVIETKREFRTSTTEPTEKAWLAAQWQLIQFCELVYREQGPLPGNLPLFVAVAIGSHIKFAEFRLLRVASASRTERESQVQELTASFDLTTPEGQERIQSKLEAIKNMIAPVLDSLRPLRVLRYLYYTDYSTPVKQSLYCETFGIYY